MFVIFTNVFAKLSFKLQNTGIYIFSKKFRRKGHFANLFAETEICVHISLNLFFILNWTFPFLEQKISAERELFVKMSGYEKNLENISVKNLDFRENFRLKNENFNENKNIWENQIL